MNRRKPVDFAELYKALDHLMTQRSSETELCYEIGRAVCSRSERGTAVMASEYLRKQYPEKTGFSPRNVRRMRDFYRTYENELALAAIALKIRWTLNVIILENCGSSEERGWYLRQVYLHKWKKSELVNAISSQAWPNHTLDLQPDFCYTEEKEMSQESECDEEDTLCVPRQYPKKPRKSLLFQWVSSLRWRLLHHNYTICERALMRQIWAACTKRCLNPLKTLDFCEAKWRIYAVLTPNLRQKFKRIIG